jgi:hypothetical protein
MKPLPLFLGLSLLLNGILFSLVAFSDRSPSSAIVAQPTPMGLAPELHAATEQSTREVALPAWNPVTVEQLPALIGRLRAAGYPPHIIRALVQAEVREALAPRRREILAKHPPPGYWQPGRLAPFDAQTMIAYREIDREQNLLIEQLLGPEGILHDEMSLAISQRRFGELPPEKIVQLNRIGSDYNDLRGEIFATSNGMLLPEDREKMAFIEREERQDLAAVLSPEELLNYELRSSSTANQLRQQLVGLTVTEEEFRALYAAARAAEDRLGTTVTVVGSPQWNQVREEMMRGLQGQLPPARIEQLQQATDPQYQMTNRLVARLGLPLSASRDIVAVQRDILQRAGTIRQNRDLSPPDRAAQLAGLEREAVARLTTTLGAPGVEAYRQFGGGWINSINAPPPPAR